MSSLELHGVGAAPNQSPRANKNRPVYCLKTSVHEQL